MINHNVSYNEKQSSAYCILRVPTQSGFYLDILIYSNEVGFIDVCWCYWDDLYLFSSVAFSVIAVVLINKKCFLGGFVSCVNNIRR